MCSCRCPSPLKSQQVEEKSRPGLLAAHTSTTLVLHCPVLHQGNIEPLIEFHFHRDIVLNNALGEISNFVFLPPYRRLDDIVTRKISDERRACAVETEMRPSIGTRSKPGNENNLRMFLKVCMHRTYLRMPLPGPGSDKPKVMIWRGDICEISKSQDLRAGDKICGEKR